MSKKETAFLARDQIKPLKLNYKAKIVKDGDGNLIPILTKSIKTIAKTLED